MGKETRVTCDSCGVDVFGKGGQDMNRLDEIRERNQKRTQGAWEAGRPDMATIVDGYRSKWIYSDDKYIAVSSGYDIDDWIQVMDNAYFIAHAPEDITYLLAEVERKDKRIQELELALSHKTVENTKLSGLSGFNATDLYR